MSHITEAQQQNAYNLFDKVASVDNTLNGCYLGFTPEDKKPIEILTENDETFKTFGSMLSLVWYLSHVLRASLNRIEHITKEDQLFVDTMKNTEDPQEYVTLGGTTNQLGNGS